MYTWYDSFPVKGTLLFVFGEGPVRGWHDWSFDGLMRIIVSNILPIYVRSSSQYQTCNSIHDSGKIIHLFFHSILISSVNSFCKLTEKHLPQRRWRCCKTFGIVFVHKLVSADMRHLESSEAFLGNLLGASDGMMVAGSEEKNPEAPSDSQC